MVALIPLLSLWLIWIVKQKIESFSYLVQAAN